LLASCGDETDVLGVLNNFARGHGHLLSITLSGVQSFRSCKLGLNAGQQLWGVALSAKPFGDAYGVAGLLQVGGQRGIDQ
jgi:hypothetical protein